jgi:hypothetical protein
MAKVALGSMIEEILGKRAGSVFQDSYGGYQVRGISNPKNPQTIMQQLRRGNFRYLSAGWRFLTSIEQLSWSSFAGSVPEGFRLFVGNNINLTLIEAAQVNTYIPATDPASFPLQINSLTTAEFIIQASTAVNIVPAGTSLLLFATTDRKPSNIFFNPSNYQPIKVFPPGTDLSTPGDIITEWSDHYGVLRADRYICIKSVIIDNSNGNRSADEIICAFSGIPATSDIIDSDGTFLIDSDGTFILAYE